MRHMTRIVSLIAVLALSGCSVIVGVGNPPKAKTDMRTVSKDCTVTPPPPYKPTAQMAEQDAIYTLAAYAVVYKDWQTHSWDQPKTARGYNIGSVLVNPQSPAGHQLVCWARNSVITTDNGTQHGEVRLMTNYLNNVSASNLKGFKLYTSLEPCAMCSGMMTLQSIATTIYGQTDPNFGGAIERLTLNSTALPDGWCPYPRGVQSVASPLLIRKQIDAAYAKAGGSITDWLTSPDARQLYQSAVEQLTNFQVKFKENQAVLDDARRFLAQVPAHYMAIPYAVGCPGAN